MSSFYNLDINHIRLIASTYFPSFCRMSLTFVCNVSFAGQNLLNLIQSHLSLLILFHELLRVLSQYPWLCQYFEVFCLFSFRLWPILMDAYGETELKTQSCFVYMWISSIPSTICWRDCLFLQSKLCYIRRISDGYSCKGLVLVPLFNLSVKYGPWPG